MGGITKTWALLKQSWAVLKHDRELVWLVAVGSFLSLVVLTAAGVPLVVAGTFESNLTLALIVMVVAGYFSSLVFTFFYVGLIAGALKRLQGGDPTVKSSLAVAWHNLGNIVVWGTITFLVGLILDFLRRNNRTAWIMLIVVALIGAAWELMTFLVEPIFISEDRSVFSSMKRSVQVLRATWGAQVGLRFGISLFYLLALLAGGGVGTLVWFGVTTFSGSGTASIVAGVAVGILIWMPIALILKTLAGITKAVVYNYTVNKVVPPEVSKESIDAIYSTYKAEA